MSFEVFLLFALGALASGAVACIAYYVRGIAAPRPPLYRYFGLALVVALASYLAGAFAGIGIACSSSSGNLCGIWGALVTGPLVAATALWAYGPVYRRVTAR